jgi:uncharacterized membrane protein
MIHVLRWIAIIGGIFFIRWVLQPMSPVRRYPDRSEDREVW